MNFLRTYVRQSSAALRLLLVLTVLLGVAYPLVITAVAAVPGVSRSVTLGQSFSSASGRPLLQYFQPRPSAGDYDGVASGASNLGPESIVGPDSLLSQVCARSALLGRTYGVSGARPYCADGVGAVLAVFPSRVVSVNQACPATPFVASYQGIRVQCAARGESFADARIVPVRGSAPSHPAVPADAVTASGSGLDPDISPAYAALQVKVVAAQRGLPVSQVTALVARYTSGRDLGFMGEPRVNVVQLNAALDREDGASGS